MKARIACALIVGLFLLSGCASTRFGHRPRSRMPVDDGKSGAFTKVSSEKISRYRLLHLSWPLDSVAVTSRFGFRNGDRHEGIDLRARAGTPVYAAHPGVVLYSGNGISGYGNMVILKHASGLATVYAHHSKNLVTRGMHIEQGDRIAYSGSTGHSSGPHLHFEVRDGSDPFDPNLILPSPNSERHRPVMLAKKHDADIRRYRSKRAVAAQEKQARTETPRSVQSSRTSHRRVSAVRHASVKPAKHTKKLLTRTEIREAAKRRALARVKLAQRQSI